jgi:hypothetical protein
MGNMSNKLKEIVFTKTLDVSMEYFPKPAVSYLPEWYKKTQSYRENKKELLFGASTSGTIKKCLPVFDALTSGYIISTYVDVLVKKDEHGNIRYTCADNQNAITFHDIIQAPYHPGMNNHPYPKWTNPWAIKTPKGYSCFFMPPVQGGNQYFSIIEGVVDTDSYYGAVHFPFVLKNIDFEGVIPAGTPMVQVFPFKREEWKMKEGSNIDHLESEEILKKLSSKFFDRYKNMFWHRKNYR